MNKAFNQSLPLHVANLIDVRAGKALPFAREQMSAIDKSPIKAPVAVNFMGLTTDIIEPWLAIDCLEDSWKTVLQKKIQSN